MAFNIVFKKSVQHDLKKIDKAEATRILDQIDQELINDPESNPALKGQFAGLRKYRVGDFRIIYAIIENDVLILRIGHRKDVYKKGL